jgi:Holliday junction resolvase RusA-like endonuclease
MSEERIIYKSLDFFISCNPPKSTHQGSMAIMRRKDGSQFVGKMQGSKGAATKKELLTLLQPHCPGVAFVGPVEMAVTWTYPWRKSEKKRNLEMGWMPCDTRPDCDNLSKLLADCMTRLGFWADDSQVAVLKFAKGWGDAPGIGIRIAEIRPVKRQVVNGFVWEI